MAGGEARKEASKYFMKRLILLGLFWKDSSDSSMADGSEGREPSEGTL